MKKENVKYSLMSAVCLALFVMIALYFGANRSTDMIMPSVYIVDGMTLWYVILLTLLSETVIVKMVLKESYLKAAAVTLMINLISMVIGFVAIHIVNLLVEVLFIPFGSPTFHISHWIVNFLLVILLNTSLEGLAAKLCFKLSFKKMFAWLCLANAVSILICILCNLSWTSVMYF